MSTPLVYKFGGCDPFSDFTNVVMIMTFIFCSFFCLTGLFFQRSLQVRLGNLIFNKLCRRPSQYVSPCKLTIFSYVFIRQLAQVKFHLLTLKVVSESPVTWATSVPIFLGLSVLKLGPMYVTDVRQSIA